MRSSPSGGGGLETAVGSPCKSTVSASTVVARCEVHKKQATGDSASAFGGHGEASSNYCCGEGASTSHSPPAGRERCRATAPKIKGQRPETEEIHTWYIGEARRKVAPNATVEQRAKLTLLRAMCMLNGACEFRTLLHSSTKGTSLAPYSSTAGSSFFRPL